MVVDVFTFNGEADMLKIHCDILGPHVDKFIIVEAKTTFSGHLKQLYFSKYEYTIKRWWSKIDLFVIDENYSPEELFLAETSPNTKGAKHWKNEFLQKESIKKALQGLDGDTQVFIGDCDEIWDPESNVPRETLSKLKLRVYAYWLDNRSSEEFWGTLSGPWELMKGKVLNHLRTDESLRTRTYHGWHFTSMGGEAEIRRKLNDSYTEDTYNSPQIQQNLANNLTLNRDFLGRTFTYRKDRHDWPEYLKTSKKLYKHLLS